MSGSRTSSVVWAIVVGLLAFSAVEVLVIGGLLEPPRLYYAWGASAVIPVVVYLFTQGLAFGGGAVAGSVHQPTAGVATPARQYSHAQSLAARGQFRRAVQVYEEALKDHPEDFEPHLRIARIYRDKLDHLELAVRWYERARVNCALNEAQQFMVGNELIEIFRHRLKAPKRAVTELEALVERFPDHPSSTAVEKELRQLRADLVPPKH
jgi:tetratricopeptide (TPR) repeat protein